MTNKIKVGSIIADSYRVQAELGSGGYGIVYLAEDILLNRQVAIKLLHLSMADPSSLQRFQREAKALSQLRQANIVSVFRFGCLDDQSPYLVMEYLEGEPLRALIRRKGGLACNEAIEIAIQVCTALRYAHENQMIHRDLKPENIMVCPTPGKPTVKILDFGLCKDVSETGMAGTTLTITGNLLGTVQYMSPEQCFGRPTDERADIYSFGCTLYEMITGNPPFVADSPTTIMLNQVNDPLPRIRNLSPTSGLPEELDALIGKCTEKEKNHRYQSFAEVLQELSHLEAYNCQARFQPVKKSGSIAASLVKVKGSISPKTAKALAITLLISFCAAVVFVTLADQGNAFLATQLQADLPADSSIAALRFLIRTLLTSGRFSAAELVKHDTTNSKTYQTWSAVDRQQLLKTYAELYRQAGKKEEAFDLSLRLLADCLDSAFKTKANWSPDPREFKNLEEVSKSLLETNAGEKTLAFARTDGVIKAKFAPFSNRRNECMQWKHYEDADPPKDGKNPFKAGSNRYLLWLSLLRAEAMSEKGVVRVSVKNNQAQNCYMSIENECLKTASIARLCNEPKVEDRCYALLEQSLVACESSESGSHRWNHVHLDLARQLGMRKASARALAENQQAFDRIPVSDTVLHLLAGLQLAHSFQITGNASRAIQIFRRSINDYEPENASQSEQESAETYHSNLTIAHDNCRDFLIIHPELKDIRTEQVLKSLENAMKSSS